MFFRATLCAAFQFFLVMASGGPILGRANLPAPMGQVTLYSLGIQLGRQVIHMMTTEGCKTVESGEGGPSLMLKLSPEQWPSGRKAAADAEKPEALMYIKEEVSIREITTGNFAGSMSVQNSDDGTMDVWDGEGLPLSLSGKDDISITDFELVVSRTTKTFIDEQIQNGFMNGTVSIEDYKDAQSKCTQVEEWRAPFTSA